MGQNYFNTLPLRLQLQQLGKCRFMHSSEFTDGVEKIRGKKMVIIGCGAQGLNQGLNLRDSGLDVSYTLREAAIVEQRQSWKNATENGFTVGTYEELIPQADMVLNLTPDKQHTSVVKQVMPLMKQGACLSYSHGFNIVEEGMQIRDDLTVIMVAPKCPGYRGARGIQTRLRRSHPDRRTHRERPQWRRTGTGQGLRRRHRWPPRRGIAIVLYRRSEVRPDGRADHSVRHAANRRHTVLRQDGRERHRSHLRLQIDPVRLGNGHRGPQVRRHHQHDGSPVQPGQNPRFPPGGRTERHHALAVREAPGRHHDRPFLQNHDGRLGQRRRQLAEMARRNSGNRL